MFARARALFLSILLPLALAGQACGPKPGPPPPPPPPEQNSLDPATNAIDAACKAKGDVDLSPRDGVCDKDWKAAVASDPTLAAECPDDKCGGVPKTKADRSFWLSPWTHVAGVLIGAAGAWTVASCANGQPGCDFWPFNGEASNTTPAENRTSNTDPDPPILIDFPAYASSVVSFMPGLAFTSTGYETDSILTILSKAEFPNPIRIGDSSYGTQSQFCIRSGYNPIGSAIGSGNQVEQTIQLVGDFQDHLVAPDHRNATLSVLDGLCKGQIGAWVAFTSDSTNTAWDIYSINPLQLGFLKVTGQPITKASSSIVKVENLQSLATATLKFQNPKNTTLVTQPYSLDANNASLEQRFSDCATNYSDRLGCLVASILAHPNIAAMGAPATGVLRLNPTSTTTALSTAFFD